MSSKSQIAAIIEGLEKVERGSTGPVQWQLARCREQLSTMVKCPNPVTTVYVIDVTADVIEEMKDKLATAGVTVVEGYDKAQLHFLHFYITDASAASAPQFAPVPTVDRWSNGGASLNPSGSIFGLDIGTLIACVLMVLTGIPAYQIVSVYAHNDKVPYTIGSSKQAVLATEGQPCSVMPATAGQLEKWCYRDSYWHGPENDTFKDSLSFDADGKLRYFGNYSGKLMVHMEPAAGTVTREFFSLGSTKDEVLAVQGTPWLIRDHNVWYYRYCEWDWAKVSFDDHGRVTSVEQKDRQFLKFQIVASDY